MAVLIGITQTPDETEQHIFTEFEGVGTTAIVGPFASSDEAANWLQFMMARTGGYKQVPSPSLSSSGQNWYGFTFECIESVAHCQQAVL